MHIRFSNNITSAGRQKPRAMRMHGLFVVVCIAALLGCSKKSNPDEGGSPRAAGATGSGQVELAAAGDEAFSADPDQSKGKDVARDGNTDYWKGVRFDVHNFEEVVDYVTTYYIEESPKKKRAWIAAANSAMALIEPRREVLPKAFFEARKTHADEEGRLDGDVVPFTCAKKEVTGVVMHLIPTNAYLKSKRKERPKRRLTDDEIRELRKKDRQRHRLYRDQWKNLEFGRREFRCGMAFVKTELARLNKEAAKAAKENPKQAASKGDTEAAPANKDTAKNDTAKNDTAKEATAKSDIAPKTKPGKAAAKVEAKSKAAPKKPVPRYGSDSKASKPKWRPDLNRAWLAAARAYLYALDPHSSVISRKAWDESTRKTENSSFEGIGAVLTQRGERTIVENPMERLPAWKAGVRAGDEIERVDGVDVRGWLLNKVVDVIRGPKATTVVLTVAREGEPKPLDIPIKRAHIPIKNVSGKLLKHHKGIGYVKMTGFIPSSTRHVRDMIAKLTKKNGGKLTGLILDLRRNSGGLLNRAIEIADMFLDHGVIVSVKSRRARVRGRPEEVHRARRDASDIKVPLLVLVNDGSASASEIVASAIQENGRGLVAGLRTFGKASVQTLFEPALHLDYYIKLTVARYYAPSGRTIQVLGVKPDIQLPPKIDGKIPLGYREENLTNHLDPIKTPHMSPLAPMIPALDACVKKSGIAASVVKSDPHPQIQPDYQLLRGADYLTCLARLQNGK